MLALGVLAVQPVAGHSFRRVSGFEPTTIGSCVNTLFHRATFNLKVEIGITGHTRANGRRGFEARHTP